MASIISIVVTGDTPTSIELLALADINGNSPSGFIAPEEMTLADGAWTYSFTATSAIYNYTYQLNWSDGTSNGPIAGQFIGPAAAGQTRATILTADAQGNPESGVTINFRLIDPPDVNSQSFSRRPFGVTSDQTGTASVVLLQGAKYEVWRDEADPVVIVTPNAPTMSVPAI